LRTGPVHKSMKETNVINDRKEMSRDGPAGTGLDVGLDLNDLRKPIETWAKAEMVFEMAVKIYASSGRTQTIPEMMASKIISGTRLERFPGVTTMSED
jgi:hypothetical protein